MGRRGRLAGELTGGLRRGGIGHYRFKGFDKHRPVVIGLR